MGGIVTSNGDAALFVVLVVAACLAYHAGRRHQAFTLARADVREQRIKLRKARRGRTVLARSAVAGWLLLAWCAAVAAGLVAVLAAR